MLTSTGLDHLERFHRGPVPTAGRPITLIHGNCQAESLRVVLDAGDLTTVRLPPVHELGPADLPRLHRWLRAADILIAQPVRDGFRDLQIGTGELMRSLTPTARTVLVPPIRFAGLYPTHAIVRPPSDPSQVPPVVAYHDLRTLAQAAGRRVPPLRPAAVEAIAAQSLSELRRRETAYDTVRASDLFTAPDFGLMRTLNHPGNPVWAALARRVRARLGLPAAPVDPGRPLLDAVHAPREPAVIDALGLDDAPTSDWTVDGATVADQDVREAHRRWYAAHPEVVDAGLARHAGTLQRLGCR